MTEKDLKRLSREDLLEILIDQMKENEDLKQKLEEAEKKLEDRSIQISECGTLAEASLKLGGVFEAVDRAVDIYLKNVAKSKKSS